MKLYGNGRAALVDDPATAERLDWAPRKKSAAEPEFALRPVAGDPAREPWIAQGRPAAGSGPRALWTSGTPGWTYLPHAPAVDRYLQAMARPPRTGPWTIGISGLGRVGGLAVSALAAADRACTGIGTILVHDADQANLERMRQELAAVASWRGETALPQVIAATLPEMLNRCDAFLFAAARGVPPLGTPGDVRLPQFAPNREALRGSLEAVAETGYTGLFLMVSDPVELLAMAAFHDSPGAGAALAPERVAGLALGVMWGRALAQAEAAGQRDRVARKGVPYGPHSIEMLAFDDPTGPDPELSRAMTEAARTGNYQVRELGFLPYIGPALSSIVLTLPRLLAGGEVLASSFVDGVFFGAPCRLRWGLAPTRRRVAPEVRAQVTDLHARLRERMVKAGLA